MPAATATSQRNRQRLDAPQIGEGLWSVFDAQGCCIVQFTTAAGDVNGLKVTTAITGVGPTLSVQGPAADINLNLAGQGAGAVVIVGPLEVTGAVTLDNTLLVKDAATFQKALTQSGGTASFDSPTLVVDETGHQVLAGVASGTGTHRVLIANSAPSGATLSAALLGLYSSAAANVMLRQTTNNVESYWQASAAGTTMGSLTAHPLLLVTTNATRISIAAGGNVTFGATALFVDETNNRVGVANAGPTVPLDVTGDVQLTGILYHSSVGASIIVPSAAGWVVRNNAGLANNLAVSDLGAVTTRSTLTVSGGGASITGSITLSGVLGFTAATSQITPGAASLVITNNAQTQNNVVILNSGATTIQGGLTVTTGGITITAGDLTLANAQLKRGTDTWLLPTGLGSDTLVTLTAVQTLQSKTLGVGTKVALGSDATGDLYYNGGSGTLTRIAIGASTTVLVGGSSPGWAQVDRTRVVLTTATGIMTLHDVQTADAAKTFTAAFTQSGGNATFDSPTLCVDATNHLVGIGTAGPGALLDMVGSVNGSLVARITNNTNGASSLCMLQAFNSGGALVYEGISAAAYNAFAPLNGGAGFWIANAVKAVYGTQSLHQVEFTQNGSTVGYITATTPGSWVMSNAALATTATDGFLYIPTCAGAPTGVPTGRTGTVPLVYDTTNNFLYIRNASAWKKTTVFA